MLSAHYAIHGVGFGVVTAVYWLCLSDGKATAQEHLGHNDLS